MCFSPVASFSAAAVLATIGFASLRKTSSYREIPFAALPLLFAIQQFIEGLVWLNLLHGTWPQIQLWLVIIYGVFAGIIWPILVPASVALLEPNHQRRVVMVGVTLVGGVVAAYVLAAMLQVTGSAQIANSCILYVYPPIPYDHWVTPIYVIATCAAFFFSAIIICVNWAL